VFVSVVTMPNLDNRHSLANGRAPVERSAPSVALRPRSRLQAHVDVALRQNERGVAPSPARTVALLLESIAAEISVLADQERQLHAMHAVSIAYVSAAAPDGAAQSPQRRRASSGPISTVRKAIDVGQYEQLCRAHGVAREMHETTNTIEQLLRTAVTSSAEYKAPLCTSQSASTLVGIAPSARQASERAREVHRPRSRAAKSERSNGWFSRRWKTTQLTSASPASARTV
jgi:hypothetical protein